MLFAYSKAHLTNLGWRLSFNSPQVCGHYLAPQTLKCCRTFRNLSSIAVWPSHVQPLSVSIFNNICKGVRKDARPKDCHEIGTVAGGVDSGIMKHGEIKKRILPNSHQLTLEWQDGTNFCPGRFEDAYTYFLEKYQHQFGVTLGLFFWSISTWSLLYSQFLKKTSLLPAWLTPKELNGSNNCSISNSLRPTGKLEQNYLLDLIPGGKM